MKIIGFGIFMWDSTERRTNRYGTFNLVESTYDEKNHEKVILDNQEIQNLRNKRVKLTAIVREARTSGHIGDMFLKVYPSTPNVGEVIELGVGIFGTENNYCGLAMGLMPDDLRDELWLDPRVLYRLHDQTVEIFAEITTEPNHVVKSFEDYNEGVIVNEEDASFQSKGKNIIGAKFSSKAKPVPGCEHTFELTRTVEPVYKEQEWLLLTDKN